MNFEDLIFYILIVIGIFIFVFMGFNALDKEMEIQDQKAEAWKNNCVCGVEGLEDQPCCNKYFK
jgi:uncharacterized membrane protein YkvI